MSQALKARCQHVAGIKIRGAVLFAICATVCAMTTAPPATAAMAGSATALGGATAPAQPVVNDAICSAGCVGLRRATVGGQVQITGKNLSMVSSVTFAGKTGRVQSQPQVKSDRQVFVTVPAGARSGKLRLRDDFGSVSRLSAQVIQIAPQRELRSAGARLQLNGAEISPRKAYLYGSRNPRLEFVVGSAAGSVDLRVDVIGAGGEIVRSYFRRGVPRNTRQTIRWDGRDTSRRPVKGGTYTFRISSQGGEPARLSNSLKRKARTARSSSPNRDPLGFQMFPFTFPVASSVSWGDSLGAGRGHQGQDLMAGCGTPVVAARGGKVIYKGDLSGAAGNYVVISGFGTKLDFAYMHLLRPVRFKVGDTIRTGQRIGLVGSTGRSTACHLHFETWGAPGWYKGGRPVNPTTMLKRWYRQ